MFLSSLLKYHLIGPQDLKAAISAALSHRSISQGIYRAGRRLSANVSACSQQYWPSSSFLSSFFRRPARVSTANARQIRPTLFSTAAAALLNETISRYRYRRLIGQKYIWKIYSPRFRPVICSFTRNKILTRWNLSFLFFKYREIFLKYINNR